VNWKREEKREAERELDRSDDTTSCVVIMAVFEVFRFGWETGKDVKRRMGSGHRRNNPNLGIEYHCYRAEL